MKRRRSSAKSKTTRSRSSSPEENLSVLYRDVVKENRNMNPLKLDSTTSTAQINWLRLEIEDRKQFLQDKVVQVYDHNERRMMHQEEERLKFKIQEDVELNGFWDPQKFEDQKRYQRRYWALAKRIHWKFGKRDRATDFDDDPVPEEFDDHNGKLRHSAPEMRIRISENITLNSDYKIPVYSDIAGEFPEDFKIPDSLLFDYIDRNVLDQATEKTLAQAVKLANKPRNTIKCNCTSKMPMTPCYLNPECRCYEVNLAFQKLQQVLTFKEAEFVSLRICIRAPKCVFLQQTFDPIMFENGLDTFFDNVGFACSELCACKGKCTNNVFHRIDKNLYPFEIFRKNQKLGFEIRSPVFIPAGTPLLEFTGAIVEDSRLSDDVKDYSMQLTSAIDDENLTEVLLNLQAWTNDFKEIIKKLSHRKFHVDCKHQGNLGRVLCHSCSPNVEVVRIFQKSVTPAHIRLLLVTLIDVYPGTSLTIDYGPSYFLGNCQCGTFACRSGPNYKKFEKMSYTTIFRCYALIAKHDEDDYLMDRKIIKELYADEPIAECRFDCINP
uniref:SET domain-containing protein n=1 Tax=Caenorhabditis japonica TaxID=281687 RepID=A0A8R1DWL8_CAEJA